MGAAVLKPEQRQAKRQKIEENRLKKQQLASVTAGSVAAQMTDDEHQLTRVITDAFIRHLNLPPHSNNSQVHTAGLSTTPHQRVAYNI